MSRASRRSRPTRVAPPEPPAHDPGQPAARCETSAVGDGPEPSIDAESAIQVDDRRTVPEFDPTDRVDLPVDCAPPDPALPPPSSRRTWSQEEIDRLMAEILAEVERLRELPGYPFVDDDWEENDDWLHDVYDVDDPYDLDGWCDAGRGPFDDDCATCRAFAEQATRTRPPDPGTAGNLLRNATTSRPPGRLAPPTPDDAEVLAAGWRLPGPDGRPGAPLGDVTLPIEAKRPLTDAAAIDLIRLAMAVPAEPQTVALLFDEQRIGGIVVVVSRTVEPDAVIDVVDHLAATASTLGEVTSMVVASIRPHRTCDGLDDVDRWFCLDEVAEFHDLQLVEWYVFDGAGSVTRPRDLTFEPSRW